MDNLRIVPMGEVAGGVGTDEKPSCRENRAAWGQERICGKKLYGPGRQTGLLERARWKDGTS